MQIIARERLVVKVSRGWVAAASASGSFSYSNGRYHLLGKVEDDERNIRMHDEKFYKCLRDEKKLSRILNEARSNFRILS